MKVFLIQGRGSTGLISMLILLFIVVGVDIVMMIMSTLPHSAPCMLAQKLGYVIHDRIKTTWYSELEYLQVTLNLYQHWFPDYINTTRLY